MTATTYSARERVAAAIVERLETISPRFTNGPFTVYRMRRDEVPESELPAVNFVIEGISQEQLSAAHQRNVMRFRIEAAIQRPDDTDLDSALADIAAEIENILAADPTLDGLAVDIRPGEVSQDGDRAAGVGTIGWIVANFEVEYWTAPGDAYSFAP